jgi:hypothetical protein
MTEITESTSVDYFIWEDFNADPYAQWVLMHMRLPAVQKSHWRNFVKDKKLFCTYESETYAVIGASRMGDVWLTSNLTGEFPYDKRVCVYDCHNFRDAPNYV